MDSIGVRKSDLASPPCGIGMTSEWLRATTFTSALLAPPWSKRSAGPRL